MKTLFLATAIILFPFFSQAQLGGLLKKAKDKINQRVDQKTDKAIDKTLDNIEGKNQVQSSTTPVSESDKATQTTANTTTIPSIKSYTKFDFVPGDKVLYSEDFAQDAIGELPLTWNASGKGEVMTINGQEGRWLRVFQGNTYLSGNRKSFGENYTIEFDLLYFFEPKVKGYVLPGWTFGLFTSGGTDAADNRFLKLRSETNNTDIRFGFGSDALAVVESKLKNQITFTSDLMRLGEPMQNFNKLVHYAVQVQKTRLRLWVNDTKVFDIPRAINSSDTLNQIFFKMDGSNYKDDEIGLFLSNLKVATGLPDTRHKLIEEGHFSTTGILFDVNAATLKPASNGVLKEIADAIKSNSGIKIKIIGHTDSDGTDAANLALSKKRAESVKAALVQDYSIDAALLETDGKGESLPVADNKTKEGKAQNRRVEFVKL